MPLQLHYHFDMACILILILCVLIFKTVQQLNVAINYLVKSKWELWHKSLSKPAHNKSPKFTFNLKHSLNCSSWKLKQTESTINPPLLISSPKAKMRRVSDEKKKEKFVFQKWKFEERRRKAFWGRVYPSFLPLQNSSQRREIPFIFGGQTLEGRSTNA